MKNRVILVFLAIALVVSLAAFVACQAEEEAPPVVVVEEEKPPPVIDWEPPAVPWEPPEEEEPTAPGVLLPIEFTLISADLGGIRLKGDDLAPYGVDLPTPVEAPWTITIPKGSTITITIGVSGHPEAGDHHFIIEGTDVDVELGVGEVLPPRDLTFNEVGTFKVYSEHLPEEIHGTIVVVEEGVTAPAALPLINLYLGGNRTWFIDLRGEDLAPYSIAPEADWINDTRVRNPWTMTVAKGATITIEIEVVADPVTLDHNLTIEGTDIDVTVGMGEKVTYDVTFNEAGTYRVYCKLHGDQMGPEPQIVVEE